MKLINRFLAIFTIIIMLFSVMPMEYYTYVFAGGTSIGVGDTSGTVGGSVGITNVRGGTRAFAAGTDPLGGNYRPTYRVSLNRNPESFYDGTPAIKNELIKSYSKSYPLLNDNTTFYFVNRQISIGSEQGRFHGVGRYSSTNRKLVYVFGDTTNKRIIKLGAKTNPADKTTLNKAKSAIQTAGISTSNGTGQNINKLIENDLWKTIANSLTMSDVMGLWNYVLDPDLSGYAASATRTNDIFTKLNAVTSQYASLTDMSTATKGQKDDILAGYTGILISLYRLSVLQGDTEQASAYAIAINDYIVSKNTKEKPVSLIIDTAVPMTITEGNRTINLEVPSIDYMQYISLVPATHDYTNKVNTVYSSVSGDTKGILLAGLAESVRLNPTGSASAKSLYRISDGTWANSGYASYQISMQNNPFFFAKSVVDYPNITISSKMNIAKWDTTYINVGYMSELTLSGNIKGFIVFGAHLPKKDPELTFTIKPSTVELKIESCETVARILTAPDIKVSMLPNSSLLTEYENKLINKTVTAEIQGKVYREMFIDGIRQEAKTQIAELSTGATGLSRTLTVDAFKKLLNGTPIILNDKSVIGKEVTGLTNKVQVVKYVYHVDADIIFKEGANTKTFKFLSDDIVEKNGTHKFNYVDYIVPSLPLSNTLPDDIEVKKPTSTSDVSLTSWYVNDQPSKYIQEYLLNTEVSSFAEIKSNVPNQERYEAMAGIPSTETVYFSAGGQEFIVNVVLQYWMNEKSVPRTYRSYFSGVACEYKDNDALKGNNSGYKESSTMVTPGAGGGTLTYNINANAHTSSTRVYAQWSGTIPNNTADPGIVGFTAGTPGSPCPGSGYTSGTIGTMPAPVNNWDMAAYNAAANAADAWAAAIGGKVYVKISDSDDKTRTWTTTVSGPSGKTYGNNAPATAPGAGYTYIPGTPSSASGYVAGLGHGAPNIPAVPPSGTPGQPGYDPGKPEVVNTHNCGTFTPATTSKTQKEANKTFTIVVEAGTMPAHAICGPCCEHDLPAVEDTWKQGLVYDYARISQIRLFKIDQASVTGMTELTGTDEIFASIKSGDPTYYMNIAQLSTLNKPILPHNPLTGDITNVKQHGNTYFGGVDKNQEAQTSQAGRIRYSLEPTQHDKVEWNEGVRTAKCDGTASTKGTNVLPAGGLGHNASQPWAVGNLYTNTTYSDVYNAHMRRNGLSNKTAYSNQADDKDMLTVEWKKFDERRRTKSVATVISDFLILQTSGGDQSIFYYHKDSESVEAQQHYPKVKSTEEDMFTNNPNSVFNKRELCGPDATLKVDSKFINIGGYNGNYKEVSATSESLNKKYHPYNEVTKQFLTVNDPAKRVATKFDTDPANTIVRPARTGKLYLSAENIPIKPSAINKVYSFDKTSVFYKQVFAFWTNDPAKGASPRANALNGARTQIYGVDLNGAETGENVDINKSKWGEEIGAEFVASYSPTHTTINDVVVYTPVSTEDAVLVPQDPIVINGSTVSRDQRVAGFSVPNLNDIINSSKVCPLDPALCEFRTLDCKYHIPTKLASFDFESSNTSLVGANWVTTNTVTGIQYTLPTGFTSENLGKVGTGSYLKAYGTRWSIPLNDLGISATSKNNVLVTMDFFMNETHANAPMLISFAGYDYWLYGADSSTSTSAGLFNTGGGTAGTYGAATVAGNIWNKKTKLELEFSLYNVYDSKIKIDGIQKPTVVRKTVSEWQMVNGVKTLVEVVKTSTSLEDSPLNMPVSRIGSTLNIGSYGSSDSYAAKYYIDNLEIWLQGGGTTHNASCYTTINVETPNNKHVHSPTCIVSTPKQDTTTTTTYADTKIFNYTGGVQQFTAPANGTYTLEVWGAQGGSAGASGGQGGYSKGNITLTKNEVIYIYVGNQPTNNSGGWNGGGSTSGAAKGGGGATDIRKGGTSLTNRIIVAGGGGGAQAGYGGFGGGLTGGTGQQICGTAGTGGTQAGGGGGASSGSLGQGGSGQTGSDGNYGGGGGGGYYGGGGGSSDSSVVDDSGGGGGSGYIGGVTGGTMSAGINPGNGYAKITYSVTDTVTIPGKYVDGIEYVLEMIKPSETKISGNVDYSYTGSIQTFTAPGTGTYTLEVWGAQGGRDNYNVTAQGGAGGYSKGNITMNKGDVINIFVGGQGDANDYDGDSPGGWNGGGNGNYAGGGGGATDIRKGGTALGNRIIVAGGGGGGASHNASAIGGSGGGVSGGNGYTDGTWANGTYYDSAPGTQSSGGSNQSGWNGSGSLGQGGHYYSSHLGGGGGGYYGGAAGGYHGGSGAGGSGYIGGVTGGTMSNGTNSGNGRAKITYTDVIVDGSSGNVSTTPFNATIWNGLTYGGNGASTRTVGTLSAGHVGQTLVIYTINANSETNTIRIPTPNFVSPVGTATNGSAWYKRTVTSGDVGTTINISGDMSSWGYIAYFVPDGWDLSQVLSTSGMDLSLSTQTDTYIMSSQYSLNNLNGYTTINTSYTGLNLHQRAFVGGISGTAPVTYGVLHNYNTPHAIFTRTSTSGSTLSSKTFNATSSGRSGSNTNNSTGSLGGTVTMSGGMYLWTVPKTGVYKIETYGAQGGNSTSYGGTGGLGAIMKGEFNLTAGQQIKILVGQQGPTGTHDGGGGGGTFVATSTNTPLIVAGGGGGASYTAPNNGLNASTSTSGTAGANGGTGGTGGNGGTTVGYGGPGGGFSTNGGGTSYGAVNGQIGLSFLNGGTGGGTVSTITGGFGGGGGTHGGGHGGGGGGGYSGGGASSSSQYGGGGGGSYNIGTNQSNAVGNSGNGKVIISELTSTSIEDYVGSEIYDMMVGSEKTILTLNNFADTKGFYNIDNTTLTPNSNLLDLVANVGSMGGTRTFNPTGTGKSGTNTNNSTGTLTGTITMSGGMYLWTVPSTGSYKIETYGAQGGESTSYATYPAGLGAIMQGNFNLTAGQQIKILVGQKGTVASAGGGGGGTFVATSTNTPLIVAGGGGGVSVYGYYNGYLNATTSTSGVSNGSVSAGSGGTGGGQSNQHGGASGGGFNTDGATFTPGTYWAQSGQAFVNGGLGGGGYSNYEGSYSGYNGYGGFGGGGEAAHNGGGGGGYSGGSGAWHSNTGSGGGGSYNAGTSQVNSVGNSGSGKVVITSLSNPNPASVGTDVDIDATAVNKIKINIDNNTTGTTGRLYYKTSSGSFSTTNSVAYTMLANGLNQTITLDMSTATGWTGKISNLKWEYTNATTGTVKLRSIEFIGFGTGTQPTSTGTGGTRTFNNTSTGRGGANSNNSSGTLGGSISLSGGIYYWTVPTTGSYKIETYGAQGGSVSGYLGGLGAIMKGDFNLTAGTVLKLLVGQQGIGGANSQGHTSGGGGGGTFVATNANSPLIVSGGGGGAYNYSGYPSSGINAVTTTTAANGQGGQTGGSSGNGGTASNSGRSSGFSGDGDNGSMSFINGGAGGLMMTNWGDYSLHGGFGGGGGAGLASGGGGGYSGGGSGTWNTIGAGGGGGSYNSGTNQVNSVGNSGHGKIIITALNVSTPLKIVSDGGKLLNTPEALLEYRTIINNNINLIPSTLPDGTPNPLLVCGGLPLNAGGIVINERIFECTEPHHQGEHYDGANRVCWTACGDDTKHANTKPSVIDGSGNTVVNSNFIQLDESFKIYFPNRGDFAGNPTMLGLSTTASQTGYGYSNRMDTTQWTREKRVRFGFNVIHNGVLYKAYDWIELNVGTNESDWYYEFENVLANGEINNASIEFEVEAVNNGIEGIPELAFSTNLESKYSTALNTFRTNLPSRWLQAITTGSGFQYDGYGYKAAYHDYKKSQEVILQNKISATTDSMNQVIQSEFYTPTTGIKDKSKSLTSNDNSLYPSNLKRSLSLESLHGGVKTFYVDLVGRIGNFTVIDTEDYRFSNFFKQSKVPTEWLVEGFIQKVDQGLQKYYTGDTYDILGHKASVGTSWLDTYGTQSWRKGLQGDINTPNLFSQVVSGDINTINPLKTEELRYGYDLYTGIDTIGSYAKGSVQVIPYYYAMNLTTGAIQKVDVHISNEGIYKPVNIWGNASNGAEIVELYKYNMNLDWTTEAERRNYSMSENIATQKAGEYLKTDIYTSVAEGDLSATPTKVGEEKIDLPTGANNYMGTAQLMLLNGKHRTFIGSESTYGVNKNPGSVLNEVEYLVHGQRWHFKLGVPSSSVFVPHGLQPTSDNIKILMNDEYAILATVQIIALGDVFALEYKQPWISSVTISGTSYDLTTSDIFPLVAVYSATQSSLLDVDIIKTH